MAIIEVVIIALICLLAGAAAGYFFGRHGTEQARQNEDLKADLAASEDRLKEYQQQVNDHFQHSAELINELTESYRLVHNHIAEGASQLTPATLEGPILKTLPEKEELDAISSSPISGDISAPLDYAPKSANPGPGMLDESYGLDKDQNEEGELLTNKAI